VASRGRRAAHSNPKPLKYTRLKQLALGVRQTHSTGGMGGRAIGRVHRCKARTADESASETIRTIAEAANLPHSNALRSWWA
jgi:hypothetical protein